jgi:hypothetical protein
MYHVDRDCCRESSETNASFRLNRSHGHGERHLLSMFAIGLEQNEDIAHSRTFIIPSQE